MSVTTLVVTGIAWILGAGVSWKLLNKTSITYALFTIFYLLGTLWTAAVIALFTGSNAVGILLATGASLVGLYLLNRLSYLMSLRGK